MATHFYRDSLQSRLVNIATHYYRGSSLSRLITISLITIATHYYRDLYYCDSLLSRLITIATHYYRDSLLSRLITIATHYYRPYRDDSTGHFVRGRAHSVGQVAPNRKRVKKGLRKPQRVSELFLNDSSFNFTLRITSL